MVSVRDDAPLAAGPRLHAWSVIRRDRPVRATALLLLSVVACFVVVDVLLRLLHNDDGSASQLVARLYVNLSVGRDDSIAEIFNHGLAFSAALLFFATAVAARSRVCLSLAVFLAIAWIDDSAQFHERVGRAFGGRFPEAEFLGVGAIHLGELVAWTPIGVLLLALIAWASRSVLPGDRTVMRLVLLPVLLLIACAVIVDVVHVPFAGTELDAAFMYLEDGGEMVAMALIAAIALYLVRNAEAVFRTA